ncbi:MAG TPA: hypothetical protein VMV10_05190 [Pirellulales bacterium]|nr:hypothetical protein [Pirellulales bacterium]
MRFVEDRGAVVHPRQVRNFAQTLERLAKSDLRFAQRLRKAGKPFNVVITACIRKLSLSSTRSSATHLRRLCKTSISATPREFEGGAPAIFMG